MSYGEDKFKAHIKAVVEAGEIDNEIGERPLTLDELKELAISMGVTEEGWKDLLEKAKTHLKAADDHLKARNFKEAVSQGEMATSINPYITNGNSVLAKAYMMLWLEEQTEDLKKKAIFHARQELKVDPKDMAAINVLSTIEKKSKVIESDQKSKKWTIIGAVGAIVLLGVLIAVVFSSSDDDPSENTYSTPGTETSDNDFIRDQLIEAEEDANMKYDQVQNAIQRRNDLLPKVGQISSISPNVIALNKDIEALRESIESAEGEEKMELEEELSTKVSELAATGRSGSESQEMQDLLVQIEGSENRIAFEKREYNKAVKEYNVLVKKHGDKYPEYELKSYYNE